MQRNGAQVLLEYENKLWWYLLIMNILERALGAFITARY